MGCLAAMVTEFRKLKFDARDSAMKAAREVEYRIGKVLEQVPPTTKLHRDLVDAAVWGWIFAHVRRPLNNYSAIHELLVAASSPAAKPHVITIRVDPGECDALAKCFASAPQRLRGRRPEHLAVELFLSRVSSPPHQDPTLLALIEEGLGSIPELQKVIVRTAQPQSSASSS